MKVFKKKLADMDIKLEHPIKDPLYLEDIYVYPELRVLSMTHKHDSPNEHIASKDVVRFLLDKKRSIIIGDSGIGKTTLAKTLCKDFLNSGIIPILIDSFELRNHLIDDIQKVVYRKFVEQYSELLLENYKQLPCSKRAILIDDMQLSVLNPEGRALLITNLKELFDIIIIFTDETLAVENLISKSSSIIALDFINCTIMEFGHYMRRVLVKKWHYTGNEYTITNEELNSKCDRDCKLITQLIGKNLLPSYPVYILLILHQLQTSKNLNDDISSYGHLYEALIKNSLLNMSSKNGVVDINTTYLSVFAYYMFSNKKKVLSDDEIEEITNSYNRNYSQDIDYNITIGELIKVKLLKGSLSECTFQYPYIYYYFVAKYLADKIEKHEVRSHIINMAQKLYNNDYGNIMIFLCHLSKSPFIADELIKNATNLFSTYTPCDFDNHCRFITSMYGKIPKVRLPNENPETNKERILKKRDEYEARLAQEDSAATTESEERDHSTADYESNISDMMQLNKAFKTIQVLGQIIKNFPGSIDGETKFFIAEEAQLLGMRTLSMFLTLIDDNVDILVNNLLESHLHNMSDSSKINPAELEEFARVYIFKIVELVSISMVKRVADSIANENLKETYKLLTQHHKETLFNLTNLAIKMDCLHVLPMDEIIKLGEKLEQANNQFSLHILRRLVTTYFYLNECDTYKKEKLCDRLKISKKEASIISAKGSFNKI